MPETTQCYFFVILLAILAVNLPEFGNDSLGLLVGYARILTTVPLGNCAKYWRNASVDRLVIKIGTSFFDKFLSITV
ncbi:MAG: hypothetical protein EAZ70_10980 [Runella slithyformis]|nr:MAG: hypothetical protein EAY79_11420 [Runella slithyformis]TAE99337.1 MAG: hypothetical protein EAZ80_05085 [Runella slithyformis]TAF25008.1 MAG: hypothetical protein EAZ70_10980 [Runella slithyformis]TAF49817.1 MAG: hypothetical protein EAZ63_00320 [Runella slithyformis]TAF79594.1 MAG: hypothetical protein EAZ50_10865 [Runella slithyformis]